MALLQRRAARVASSAGQREVGLGGVAAATRSEVPAVALDEPCTCDTTILTSFFVTREDPQRHNFVAPSAEYFRKFYDSVLSVPGGRVRAVVLHDGLPENLTREYTTANGTFAFVKVDLSRFERQLGLNDLRFMLFEDQLRQHREWSAVFMADIRDVVVLHNPCALVARHPQKLFVGSQEDDLKADLCLGRHFAEMGGKYLRWYQRTPRGRFSVLSPGIVGGSRAVLLDLLPRYNAAMLDPALVMRQAGKHKFPKCRSGAGPSGSAPPKRKSDVHLVRSNMPAFNYVVRTGYRLDQVVTGRPLHSVFRRWENRTDVYFRHK